MPYLLDTNVVIALMKENIPVMAQVRRVGRAELRLCAPVEAELWFGGKHSDPLPPTLIRANLRVA